MGARQARELALLVGTDECWCRRLGIWKTYGSGGLPALPEAARAPGLRDPGGERAVLLRADLDLGEGRRAVAGDRQLGVAVEHQLDRRAGDLRELGALDRPSGRR